MKMFLDEFTVLDMNDLIAVNGGYGSSSYSTSSVPSGYSVSSVLLSGYKDGLFSRDDVSDNPAQLFYTGYENE